MIEIKDKPDIYPANIAPRFDRNHSLLLKPSIPTPLKGSNPSYNTTPLITDLT